MGKAPRRDRTGVNQKRYEGRQKMCKYQKGVQRGRQDVGLRVWVERER